MMLLAFNTLYIILAIPGLHGQSTKVLSTFPASDEQPILNNLADSLQRLAEFNQNKDGESLLQTKPITNSEFYSKCEWDDHWFPYCITYDHTKDPLIVPLPPNACHVFDCNNCITINQTFIIYHNQLVPLTKNTQYLMNEKSTDRHDLNYTTDCKNKQTPCQCTEICYADRATCRLLPASSCQVVPDVQFHRIIDGCKCYTVDVRIEMILHTEHPDEFEGNITILQPITYQFPICYQSIQKSSLKDSIKNRQRRHVPTIVEEEIKNPTTNKYIKLIDDILVAGGPGDVIFSKNGVTMRTRVFENTSNHVSIPQDFFIHDGVLKIYFVPLSGEMEQLSIYAPKRTICKRLHCLFCVDILYHLDCLPAYANYFIYAITLMIFVTCVYYLHVLFKGIYLTIHSGYQLGRILWRMGKTVFKFILLTGAYFGLESKKSLMEKQLRMQSVLPILIYICTLITKVLPCNDVLASHLVIHKCINDVIGKQCVMSGMIEATLPNLKYQQCITILNQANNKPIMTFSLTYVDQLCYVMTQRMYFTAPYHIGSFTDRACFNNQYCGQGDHCHRGYRFEEMIERQNSWPGISNCIAGKNSVFLECLFSKDRICNFYYHYFVPDFNQVYDVRKPLSLICVPRLELKVTYTNATQKTFFFEQELQQFGMKFTVLGQFEKPNIFLDEYFIQKFADPSQLYLAPAAVQGVPKINMIGDMQMQTPVDKEFILDQDMVKCKLAVKTLNCETPESPLFNKKRMENYALPRDYGTYRLHAGNSTQIIARPQQVSPIKIHISLSNYKVIFNSDLVCPKIESIGDIEGCYACDTLASIKFQALTTCLEGSVMVYLETNETQRIMIILKKQVLDYVYEFSSSVKCINTEFCLSGAEHTICKPISFCLEEPEIILSDPSIIHVHTEFTQKAKSQGFSLGSIWSAITSIIPSFAFLGTFFNTIFQFIIFMAVLTCVAFGISFAISFMAHKRTTDDTTYPNNTYVSDTFTTDTYADYDEVDL